MPCTLTGSSETVGYQLNNRIERPERRRSGLFCLQKGVMHVNRQQNGHQPLFRLGTVLITPGAILALVEANQSALELLKRHAYGDWGELNAADWLANERALQEGTRLLSAYILNTGQRLWIISEWDRSMTTLLTPTEY